ncbi:hypothetical protein AB1L88_02450 [Tautonia sp. JC769]|uniref:hypothetical protein n=1 Tax=Tautonia sp. JC769 TaxID=3232135 RepID=UPI0034592A90
MTTLLDDPDDISWLAYCYVAGELDEAAQGAFEARLLDDPEACLAVAQAVELIGACLRLDSTPQADRPDRAFPRKRPAIALTSLVAAAAILLAAVSIPRNPPPADGEGAGRASVSLELAWSSLRRDARLPLLDAESDAGWDDLGRAEDDDPARLDPEGELPLDPPRWLLVAVDHDANPGDPTSRSPGN